MQTSTVKILGLYNQRANAKMNEIIKTLSPEEWERPLGGYFPSVRSLCSHTYIADFSWLKRFSQSAGRLGTFAVFKDPLFSRDYSFSELLFPAPGEYLESRPVLDGLLMDFANELDEGDLAGDLHYSNSAGDRFSKNFGGLLLHVFNHETHHRGMISLYLEILGRANDFNSLSAVL
ncbi:MAG: DinB family protein [Treponema sp.]|jgi:uncharacterized damage-inducible protein DinB|nr:DinB family protein [Treponema sp.]